MPFVPAPGTAEFVIAGKFASAETIVSVLHVQRKNDAVFSPWTQANLRDGALRLSLGWQRFLSRISTSVAWTEIRSRDLTTETGAVDLLSVALTGTSVSAPTSCNVTYLIQWRTGTAGRGANGRTYLPGCTEDKVDSVGRVLTATVGDLGTAAQGVLTDLAAATATLTPGPPLDMVILHGPKGSPQTRSATPVTIGRGSDLVGTQRRRLPRRV